MAFCGGKKNEEDIAKNPPKKGYFEKWKGKGSTSSHQPARADLWNPNNKNSPDIIQIEDCQSVETSVQFYRRLEGLIETTQKDLGLAERVKKPFNDPRFNLPRDLVFMFRIHWRGHCWTIFKAYEEFVELLSDMHGRAEVYQHKIRDYIQKKHSEELTATDNQGQGRRKSYSGKHKFLNKFADIESSDFPDMDYDFDDYFDNNAYLESPEQYQYKLELSRALHRFLVNELDITFAKGDGPFGDFETLISWLGFSYPFYELGFDKSAEFPCQKLAKGGQADDRFQRIVKDVTKHWQDRWIVVGPNNVFYFEKPFDSPNGCRDCLAFDGDSSLELTHVGRKHVECILSISRKELHLRFSGVLTGLINYYHIVAAMKRSNYCQPHRFSSFAPIRQSNECDLFSDGVGYYKRLKHAFEICSKEILITDWWFSPEISLERPINPATFEDDRLSPRLDKVLKRAAERGVKIYILLFKEFAAGLNNDSEHAERHMENLHPNIMVIRHPNVVVSLWSHHEKLVVIDRKIVFMGGLDLCWGRMDGNNHPLFDKYETMFHNADFYNPLKKDIVKGRDWLTSPIKTECSQDGEYPRMPWHDIACMLVGPIVNDYVYHFNSYWNHAKETNYDDFIRVRDEDKHKKGKSAQTAQEQLREEADNQMAMAALLQGTTGENAGRYDEGEKTNNPFKKLGKVFKEDYQSNQVAVQNNPQAGQDLMSIFAGQNVNVAQALVDQVMMVEPDTSNASNKNFTNSWRDWYNTYGHQYFSNSSEAMPEQKPVFRNAKSLQSQGLQVNLQNHWTTNINQPLWDNNEGNRIEVIDQILLGGINQVFSHNQGAVNKAFPNENRGQVYGAYHCENIPRYAEREFIEPRGKFKMQALRSSNRWSLGKKYTESSIHECYLEAIDNAERFIYVENQFIISATDDSGVQNLIIKALYARIKRAFNERMAFKVVIFLPLMPAFEASLEKKEGKVMQIQIGLENKTIGKGNLSLIGKLNEMFEQDPEFANLPVNARPSAEHYVLVGALRTWELRPSDKMPVTEIIYIHSKVAFY